MKHLQTGGGQERREMSMCSPIVVKMCWVLCKNGRGAHKPLEGRT
jgi:hypothetical protein